MLTTYRRNGEQVSTLVEIRVGGGKAYSDSWSTTAKVKRLAHNPRVELAPATLSGQWV